MKKILLKLKLIQDLLRFVPERVVKQYQSRENFLIKMGEQAFRLKKEELIEIKQNEKFLNNKNIEFGEESNNG